MSDAAKNGAVMRALAEMTRHACPESGPANDRLAMQAHDRLAGLAQEAKYEWDATRRAIDAVTAERDELRRWYLCAECQHNVARAERAEERLRLSLAAWESAGMQGRSAADAMLALQARVERAEAALEDVRTRLRGYPDSKLDGDGGLAAAVMREADAAKAALEGLLDAARAADEECERHEPGLRMLRRALASPDLDAILAARGRT